MDIQRPTDERLEPPAGTFLEVVLRRNAKPDVLEYKTESYG
jgi:hypothetical protein